ncbi:MAG: AI-2E family transporter [Actinomycetia bacterium]|nr:AI-2E family transporter [Actinomycetes bacterium]
MADGRLGRGPWLAPGLMARRRRGASSLPSAPQPGTADDAPVADWGDDDEGDPFADGARTPQERADALVPFPLRVAAGWGWRLLVVVAVGAGVVWLAGQLSEVVMPLFCAFLLTAALEPFNRFLVGKRWPPWAAALTCVLFLLIVVGGLLTLVGAQIATQAPMLGTQLANGFAQLVDWLSTSRFHISSDQMNTWANQMIATLRQQSASIAGWVAQAGGTIGRFLTGLIMCLFALFFFLKDGRRFARTAIGWVPPRPRRRIAPALLSGWSSMVNYVKAVVIVAAVDGLGAGLGAALLGSNLWVAIMALTFVCAFVPMLGALVAGAVGVTVVLATLGWVKALIMLAVFVIVLEGEVHIMQPLLLSRAVDIHPLVVLVSIAIGIVVAGIPGGVFAIPLVALANGVIQEMARGRATRSTRDT